MATMYLSHRLIAALLLGASLPGGVLAQAVKPFTYDYSHNMLQRYGERQLRLAAPIASLEWSPKGDFLLATDEKSRVHAWTPTGAAMSIADGLSARHVQLMPDARRLLMGGNDDDGSGALIFLDLRSGERECIDLEGVRRLEHLCPLSGDRVFVSFGGQHAIFDARSGRCIKKVPVSGRALILEVVAGRVIASISPADKPMQLKFIDMDTGFVLSQADIELDQDDTPQQMRFSPDGKVLGVLSWRTGFRVIRVSDGKVLHDFPNDAEGDPEYMGFTFTPDNKSILLGEWEGPIHLFDRSTGRLQRSYPGVRYCNNKMQVSPNGEVLATAGDRETVFLYDLKTGKLIAPRGPGHTGAVHQVAYSRTGDRVITTSKDRTIRVWDTKTGQQLSLLEGSESEIMNVAIHPDGRTLLSAGTYDQFLHFWDINTGQQLDAIPVHSRMSKLTLAPNGAWFATLVQRQIYLGDWKLRQVRKLPLEFTNHPRGIFALSDNRTILAALHSEIVLVDTTTGAITSSRNLGERLDDLCAKVAMSADNAFLAYPDGSSIRLVEIATLDVTKAAFFLPPIGFLRPFPWNSLEVLEFLPDLRVLYGDCEGYVGVWDPASWPRHVGLHNGPVWTLRSSRDGSEFLSGSADTTAIRWRTPPPAQSEGKFGIEQMKQIWLDLKVGDVNIAVKSMIQAIRHPGQALTLFTEELKPAAAVPEALVRDLIEDLRSPTFSIRSKAFDTLAGCDRAAEKALRARLEHKLDAQEQESIERLLKLMTVWSGDRLRELRTVQCVERIETPEAITLLRRWASGDPDARLTTLAKAALARRLAP